MMNHRNLNIDLYKWVDEQQLDWCMATYNVCGQRSIPVNGLSRLLHTELSRLNRKVFGNAYKRYGKQLRRIAVPGGDPLTGTFIHYHLLIEKPRHLDLTTFNEYANTTWRETLKAVFPIHYAVTGEVWMKPYLGSSKHYLFYTIREESPILGYGVNKIDWDNTYLSPFHS
jgi:hypothetical protein